VWATFLLGLALIGLAAFLTIGKIETVSTLLGKLVLYPGLALLAGLTLFLVIGLTYILSRGNVILPAPVKEYLQHIVQTEGKVLLGDKASGLAHQNISLEDVYIPLSFYPGQVSVERFLHGKEWQPIPDELKDPFVSKRATMPLNVAGQIDYSRSQQHRQIELAELWQRLLKEQTAFVLQGGVGAGKSTLVAWLARHMALRNLGLSDSSREEPLEPHLLPILFHLDDYIAAHAKSMPVLSLVDYLTSALKKSDMSLEKERTETIAETLRKYLERGRCLVMFDGLDEVSDEKTRRQAYRAIYDFILTWSSSSGNCFLITSRLAASEMGELASYPLYVIKELSIQQMEEFVSRWFSASEKRRHQKETPGSEKQPDVKGTLTARKNTDVLTHLIRNQRGVQNLARNPLLLTFLVIIQQNNISFHKQRVDLYEVITRLLLEKQEYTRSKAPFSEELAVERLGLLAYQMQEQATGLLYRGDVLRLLQQAIQKERDSTSEAGQEARDFLSFVSQKAGLLAERVDEHYSFVHRTFQEYFTARHILNICKHDTNAGFSVFLDKTYTQDEFWREPFLLAVAYDSQRHSVFADRVIDALLGLARGAYFTEKQHYLLLAVECLMESRPLSISRKLEEEAARQLLATYQEAHKRSSTVVCERIQNALLRWLLGLPVEVYRSALLVTLCDAIVGEPEPSLAYPTLLLLSRIAYEIKESPAIVFKSLLPVLLQVANTTQKETYRLSLPDPAIDPVLADLALTVLSLIGSQGPAGTFLKNTRQFFSQSPDHLRRLARYSLENKVLLTPAIIPFHAGKYLIYQSAVADWKALLHHSRGRSLTTGDIEKSLDIQRSLLNCAEEVCYPIIPIFLEVVEKAGEHVIAWQAYLLNRLRKCKGIEYALTLLFWSVLFPEKQALRIITSLVQSDFSHEQSPQRRGAQHFLAMISKSTPSLRDMEYIRNIWYIWYINNDYDVKKMRELDDLQILEEPPGLQSLRQALLSCEVAEQARARLSKATMLERLEIFAIQLGRLQELPEKKEADQGKSVETEVEEIAWLAIEDLTEKKLSETRSLSQELISHLPVRTRSEIAFVLSLAEGTNDKQLQQLCALVLKQAQARSPELWATLGPIQARAREIQMRVEARTRETI